MNIPWKLFAMWVEGRVQSLLLQPAVLANASLAVLLREQSYHWLKSLFALARFGHASADLIL